ncbi:MAG: ABC transporter substrate-binding protein [Chloroflexota bacterium]
MAATLALLTALTSCHAATPWRGIIKVAIVAPYSGPVTSPGQSLLIGARLAESEINAAGGVDGYRVLLIAPDERQASTPSEVATDPLVMAVIGQLLPDDTGAVATYRRAGIVWLAAEPVAPGDGVYPMVATTRSYYSALDREIGASGVGTGGVVTDPAVACQGASGRDAGIVVIGNVEAFCGGHPDRLAAILADPPTGGRVICVAAWCGAPELAAWANGRPYDYVVPVAEPASSVDWRSFVAATGGAARVETDAAIGDDGVHLVADALRRAIARGQVNRQAIAEEMAATRYHGLLGQYDGAGSVAPVTEVRREAGSFPGQLMFRVEGQP